MLVIISSFCATKSQYIKNSEGQSNIQINNDDKNELIQHW